MRRGLAYGAVCLAAVSLGACGTRDDQRQARRSAEALYAAVAGRDGRAACAQLTPAAVKALVQQAKSPCAKAIVDVQLAGRRAAEVEVYETDALVRFAGGDDAYVERTPAGWRVSAIGCRPKGKAPADCQLEG